MRQKDFHFWHNRNAAEGQSLKHCSLLYFQDANSVPTVVYGVSKMLLKLQKELAWQAWKRKPNGTGEVGHYIFMVLKNKCIIPW